MSGLDHRLEPEGEIRRFEVINGAVARRHGLTPQQLFTWRRAARKQLETEAPPTFVPAVVVAPEPVETKDLKPRTKRRVAHRRAAAIEVEASGVTVRIGDGASPAAIAAVIGALKGAS